MYAGALFIQQALHWDLYVAVTGLLAITAVYTVAGASPHRRPQTGHSTAPQPPSLPRCTGCPALAPCLLGSLHVSLLIVPELMKGACPFQQPSQAKPRKRIEYVSMCQYHPLVPKWAAQGCLFQFSP